MAGSSFRMMGWMGALSLAAAAGPGLSFVEPVPGSREAPFGESRYRRSRGKQAKPKKRPNMLHVSKRVRRKHRRAAQ